jgi:hypothetical protein
LIDVQEPGNSEQVNNGDKLKTREQGNSDGLVAHRRRSQQEDRIEGTSSSRMHP